MRTATLVATGQPGSLQIRLMDPATQNERAGLGACVGDSGAPVFTNAGGALAVIGVVSWSTGPKNAAGCGGLTGVTPLARYRVDRGTGEADGFAARAVTPNARILARSPPRRDASGRALTTPSLFGTAACRRGTASAGPDACNGSRKRAADGGRAPF